MRDLLVFTENEQNPTIVGTDANVHHTIWGSFDINPRGKDLLAYCASANLNFCNVGNKPTFRTKTRGEEVLDLTLVNRCEWNRVVGWHVSVTNNNFECLRYDYLLYFNVYVTDLLLLLLFCDLKYSRYSGLFLCSTFLYFLQLSMFGLFTTLNCYI